MLPTWYCFVLFGAAIVYFFIVFFNFLFYFCLFRAAPVAYGRSQASVWIGAVASSLPPSHSNMGSELCLRPTPQPQQCGIRATSATYTRAHGNARSLTHWAKAGIKPSPSWTLVGFINCWATTGTPQNTTSFKRHERKNITWILLPFFWIL